MLFLVMLPGASQAPVAVAGMVWYVLCTVSPTTHNENETNNLVTIPVTRSAQHFKASQAK